jgi:DNA-binding winged helix-turn-helix (wHTH) protein
VTYRFDDFALDGDTRRLLRRNQEIHLSPKAFELLFALVTNRARAMSRRELHEHLWPATFVQDANLAGVVAEIRRALEDAVESPRYIRTVPRFGYWFIGPLAGSPVEASRPPASGATSTLPCWILFNGRQVQLVAGDNILGRAPDAIVWIDETNVSRHHARIYVDAMSATIEDLGSKNGTFMRGERLMAPRRLADGDEIQLGSVVITFRSPGAGDLTETATI